MITAKQMLRLDKCTTRMAYEWDKLYRYNQLLDTHPHIASHLRVCIKKAHPVHDYYYPEFLTEYALVVYINVSAQAARKLNVIPFYPTRALLEEPLLAHEMDLRFFQSGKTIVPFMGPMMEVGARTPMRYSDRFQCAVYENVEYLRWGLDHLSRHNSSYATVKQLGSGFTVDEAPYVDPEHGYEAPRFLVDANLCGVYHKGFDGKECTNTAWQTATEYAGFSYLWGLMEYGADLKSIYAPRLEYRLPVDLEQRMIRDFMTFFNEVNPLALPLNLWRPISQEWGLTDTDCVWVRMGDSTPDALYRGADCVFSNGSKGVPNHLMTDKYGFPKRDAEWLNFYKDYQKAAHLGDTDDYMEFFNSMVQIFGTDALLGAGTMLTSDWFIGRMEKTASLVADVLPRGLVTRLGVNSLVVDTVQAMGSSLRLLNGVFNATNIVLMITGIVDAILQAVDPVGVGERPTQALLDKVAARSHEAIVGVFGTRNPRVEFGHIASTFSIPSSLNRIKIAFMAYSLQEGTTTRFKFAANLGYLLGISCLWQLCFPL